jgi:hypothetical protein
MSREADMTEQPRIEEQRAEPNDSARRNAIERLGAKRDLSTHVIVYLVVNSALIAIWAVTGGGYFWPVWVLAGWGIGLILHAWEIYGHRPITEDDIRREMERQRR